MDNFVASLDQILYDWKQYCVEHKRIVEIGVNIDMTLKEFLAHASMFDNIEIFCDHILKYKGTILELRTTPLLFTTLDRFTIKPNENILIIKVKE